MERNRKRLNFDKPYEDLRQDQKKKVLRRIIKRSGKTNFAINTISEVTRIGGGVLLVVAAAVAWDEIQNARDKARETVRQGTQFSTAIAVAPKGTQIGARYATAMLARALGPRLVLVSRIFGGVAGGIIAAELVSELIDFLVPPEGDELTLADFDDVA